MNIDAIVGMNARWAAPKLPDAMHVPVPSPNPPTAADIARRLERSRALSALMEFGAVLVCSLIAALIAGTILYGQLATTFGDVTPHL